VSISVIIPVLNEEVCLPETLRQVREQRPHEIIVVDGGSTDATCTVAAAADRLLHSPPGRAVQMNLGAVHATGDVLLFLHADCVPEAGALAKAERALDVRGVVAGCFTMRVRASGLLYRSIDACATARVRLTGLVYGDQGLFLRRERFEHLGGFPPLRLMEDLFFSRELRRHGRIVVLPRCLFVSPRRWQRAGLVRQTLRNWTLTALVAAGVPPDRLAAFYPAVR
jgi:rSAM/selenodomain-associated transferase 2